MKNIVILTIFIAFYLIAPDFLLGFGNESVIFGRNKNIVTTCKNNKELSKIHVFYKIGCKIGDIFE